MKQQRLQALTIVAAALALISSQAAGDQILGPWQVVVNNGDIVPGDTRNFNSYNQPSLSMDGFVVFRARSQSGSGGEPAHGIFARDMSLRLPMITVFDRNTLVPWPNNLDSMFTEPPSFPRIDMLSHTIASRGNHPPVWEYILPDETESRAGTTGIYTNPYGLLIPGESNLGAVPDFPFFSVPGVDGVKFDVFPGAPAVTDESTIVFKGNYTIPDPENPDQTISKTGVYYRDLLPAPTGGTGPAVLIANSDTLIPGTSTLFGSTAPPSAAGRFAVFTGWDNEFAPTLGGIYLAPLEGPNPPLTTLVEIGGQVPGEEEGVTFNQLGEGLSFDGRFVGFWGSFGSETRTITLQCPTDGNKDLIQYCNEQYPDGYTTTVPCSRAFSWRTWSPVSPLSSPRRQLTSTIASTGTSRATCRESAAAKTMARNRRDGALPHSLRYPARRMKTRQMTCLKPSSRRHQESSATQKARLMGCIGGRRREGRHWSRSCKQEWMGH